MSSNTSSRASSVKPGNAPKLTVLAFHGSGSNAACHSIQFVRISRGLMREFTFESMQGPYPSPAGPGMLPFFEGMNPWYKWLPATESVSLDTMRNGTGTSVMPLEVEALIRAKVREIRADGGKVVGAIGFSQGTKIVTGLLRGSEIYHEVKAAGGEVSEEYDWLEDFSFGVSVCGSYPPGLVPQSARTLLRDSSLSQEQKDEIEGKKARLPTLHLLGTQDNFISYGRLLVEMCYETGEGMSEVRETDGAHHYPQRVEDNERAVEWVRNTWDRVRDGR